jgi:hypothetical protein
MARLSRLLTKALLPREYACDPADTWPHKKHSTTLLALRLVRTKHGRRLVYVFTEAEGKGQLLFLKTVEDCGPGVSQSLSTPQGGQYFWMRG